ncbi:MAG: ABC transporter substrate-binding protein [Chloroflexi bacterium]|nr:ABC transporter substrate-binding protein [Chloroflexota bacterium]
MRKIRWPSPLGILAIVGAMTLLVASCAPAPTSIPSTPTPAPPVKMRIGLLPIIDSVPFYAAEADGLFKAAGLEVELVTFASAFERDAAIQSGQIDGQLADLIASGLLNAQERRIRIVKTTHRGTPARSMISLVAGKASSISSPADLKGKKVAISHNTIIEYSADELLRQAGVDPNSVEKVEVARIPVRMEMLAQGQIEAAILPEPLTTLAVNTGGRLLLGDGQTGTGISVLEFRIPFLEQNKEAVRAFVAAHDKAVKAANADPEKYRPLLSEKANLPAVLKESFTVPLFPETDIPTQAEIDRVMSWLVSKGLIPKAVPYSEMADSSFLPRK